MMLQEKRKHKNYYDDFTKKTIPSDLFKKECAQHEHAADV